MNSFVLQFLYACGFYVLVVGLFRLAGKRHAGHVTTFDLIILISMAVAIQKATLLEGGAETMIFVGTTLLMHRAQTWLCRKFPAYRHWLRGRATKLIRDGKIDLEALEAEGLTIEELRAGLRKAGLAQISGASEARIEETGQISAIPKPKKLDGQFGA